MDFFAQQDKARKNTGLLLLYFTLAIIATVLMVYFLPVLGWNIYAAQKAPSGAEPPGWWFPQIFMWVTGGTLLVVLAGASLKIVELRRGGGRVVAEMLGGREVLPNTDDFYERRLRNVVEEMAIASGTPVPPVFVMPKEKGINAFAAGFSVSDSVVAVTYGTMTGLKRDELQGVVAHEFSHILNNDMAINIRLMGMLHGLLLIALTGQFILEMGMYSGAGRSRDNKGGGLPILAIALCLIVVGYTGIFFANLIKASVSRSRERLADASAVQFTRNPAGLASALKKIGGLSYGSRIRNPRAEETSHMFFGNGLRFSFFRTHPPIAERVKWLEPQFDGAFDKVTLDELYEQNAQSEGAPRLTDEVEDVASLYTKKPVQAAVAAAVMTEAPKPAYRPNNPEALIDSVGKPMEHHADAAKQLIASIPDRVKEYARDPYGARMLIYFLLLDSDQTIRNKQMEVIKSQAEPEVFKTLETAIPNIGMITPQMRLPIVDLAIPALRFLAISQYEAFRSIVKQLIDADEKVDIFEYALQRVLIHHLDPVFSGNHKSKPVNYYAIRGLAPETSTVLSVMARNGHDAEEEAQDAFNSAVSSIPDLKAEFNLLGEHECSWDQFDAALDKLNESSFKVKKWVLGAALACLMHDREITVEEVELFRAVADTLGCPVPPWVAPGEAG